VRKVPSFKLGERSVRSSARPSTPLRWNAKVLLACGAAAGMSATFNTPIAGVILAIELLLFEFKSRSFIPLVIASTLATAVHNATLGRRTDVPGQPDGLLYSARACLFIWCWA